MKVNSNMNEGGFTLLESLIALMISSVILLLLTSILAQLNKVNELIIKDAQIVTSSESKIYGSRQIEWHIFLAQLEAYLKNTKLVESTAHQLIVIEKDEKNGKEQNIRYGQAMTGYQNFYRRSNNGYHEMLTAINSFELKVDGNCLELIFKFQNGELYKGKVWVDDWQEKEEKTEENETDRVRRWLPSAVNYFCINFICSDNAEYYLDID